MNYLIKSCLFKIKEELNTSHYSSTTLLSRLQRLAQKSTADADNQSSLQEHIMRWAAMLSKQYLQSSSVCILCNRMGGGRNYSNKYTIYFLETLPFHGNTM